MSIEEEQIRTVFIAQNVLSPFDASITCGYDGNGQITFGCYDADKYKILFKMTPATFDEMCNQLGVRSPLFQDQMKSYLDERFDELKKLLGA